MNKPRITEEDIFLEYFKQWHDQVTLTNELYPETKDIYDGIICRDGEAIRYKKAEDSKTSKNRPVVQKYTKKFLKNGYLDSSKRSLTKYRKRKNRYHKYELKSVPCVRANLNRFFERLASEHKNLQKKTKALLNVFFERGLLRQQVAQLGRSSSFFDAVSRIIDNYLINPYLQTNMLFRYSLVEVKAISSEKLQPHIDAISEIGVAFPTHSNKDFLLFLNTLSEEEFNYLVANYFIKLDTFVDLCNNVLDVGKKSFIVNLLQDKLNFMVNNYRIELRGQMNYISSPVKISEIIDYYDDRIRLIRDALMVFKALTVEEWNKLEEELVNQRREVGEYFRII